MVVIVGGNCGWWCIVVVIVGGDCGECGWWCIHCEGNCGR